MRLDVAVPGAAVDIVKKITAEYGRIDILVNNAGISDGNQRPATADLTVASRVWQVNVLGSWQCANAVVPAMRDAGYGRIVNMSSTLGSLFHMDRGTEPAYRVSEAALNALTHSPTTDPPAVSFIEAGAAVPHGQNWFYDAAGDVIEYGQYLLAGERLCSCE